VLEFLNNLLGARNRVGIGLSYRPARLHKLAEFIPCNRFLGSLKVYKFGLSCWCTAGWWGGGTCSCLLCTFLPKSYKEVAHASTVTFIPGNMYTTYSIVYLFFRHFILASCETSCLRFFLYYTNHFFRSETHIQWNTCMSCDDGCKTCETLVSYLLTLAVFSSKL
jgi:hypothetical protein